MNIYYVTKILKILTAILLLGLGLSTAASADKSQQCRANIQLLLNDYEQALNNSDVKRVVSLYTDDGIFMPSNKPTAVGEEQVNIAYQHVFKALDLDVKFHVNEIEYFGDIAFARTTSDGKIKILEKNTTINNNSRELFILKRVDKKWKIYRYMFNEMSSQM